MTRLLSFILPLSYIFRIRGWIEIPKAPSSSFCVTYCYPAKQEKNKTDALVESAVEGVSVHFVPQTFPQETFLFPTSLCTKCKIIIPPVGANQIVSWHLYSMGRGWEGGQSVFLLALWPPTRKNLCLHAKLFRFLRLYLIGRSTIWRVRRKSK